MNKVTEADLSNFDTATNTFTIKKKTTIKIEENSYYLIELKDSLLNSNELAYTLNNNLNNGNPPKHKYYKVVVNSSLGKIIKVDGRAYDYATKTDLNIFWSGYLLVSEINILEKLS